MTIECFIKNWKNIKEEDIDFTVEEWKDISSYEYLPEEFMEKYQDKVYWNYISTDQNLSEEFMEKYKDKVDWDYISAYQKLSEEFIEKYENKVDWFFISIFQKLSEAFIYKHKEKISHPSCLRKYYRERYIKYNNALVLFSIHTNANYGIILEWKKPGFNISSIPSNITFSQIL